MEAVEGVGNVSAHRGMAYIVFTDQEGAQFNNHIPSLTFEVFTSTQSIPWRVSTFTPDNNDSTTGFGLPQNGMIEDGVLKLAIIPDWHNDTDGFFTFSINSYDFDGNLLEAGDIVAMAFPLGGTNPVTAYRCMNNVHICHAIANSAGPSEPDALAFYYDGVKTTSVKDLAGSAGFAWAISASASTFANDAIYNVAGFGPAYVAKWSAPGGACTDGQPTEFYALPGTGAIGIGTGWLAVNDDVGNVWVMGHRAQCLAQSVDQLWKFDADLNLLHSWAVADMPAATGTGSVAFTVWHDIICFNRGVSNDDDAYYINSDFTFTFAGTLSTTIGNVISLGNGYCLIGDGIISLQPRPGPTTLGAIVENVSVRTGLTTDQVDVTELTDLVDGYVIPSQMAARSAIEPLQAPWPFDAVEHDTVVRFPRRGVDGVQATLDDNDLGAFVPPGTAPALMITQRMQEVDLPRIMDVSFLNYDTDYQNGEARAQRLITTSEMATALQLPIVMTTQHGESVASTLLYNAWIERERFSLSLSRKWLLLEPADVIEARGRTMRITRKVEQADGVIKIDALATSLSVYQRLAPPVEGVGMPGGGGTPPTTPPVLQQTDAILLDLPLVRDSDDQLGWYLAMAGHTQPSWPGATLYKSIDGGSSYNAYVSSTTSDTFGDCSITLGDFLGGNVFDELNSLTVVLTAGSGTLSSVTRLAVLNGANMAVVGTPGETGVRSMEIIQFRDAELTGTRTYRLTGLLRGRRGTEWMIGSHVSGEKFVLLPTATNTNADTSDLYLTRQYRAVTSGLPITGTAVQNFANWGMTMLPYAPVNLGGGHLANGDILLTWQRRTRIGGLWMPYVDVPLSEPHEEYAVTIYSDSSYAGTVRVIFGAGAITSESYTYTLADQMVDFGSPTPTTIYWGVRQLGTYALGTEARGQI